MLVSPEVAAARRPEPERVHDEQADDTAVADKRDPLGAASGFDQPRHVGAYPFAHLLVGLAAFPASSTGMAACIPRGEPLLRLGVREACPVPHIDLAERGVGVGPKFAHLADDLRGLQGTFQIGRVDLRDALDA